MIHDLLTAFIVLCVAGIIGDTMVKIYKAKSSGGKKLEEKIGRMEALLADQNAALDAAHQGLVDQATQIQELNERLDFAERMLTQSKERPGLPRG